jgi:hypothetical protein
MKASKIALAVKTYLVDLAVEDKLPLDLTQLSMTELVNVIQGELPTKEEETIERASHYLCEGDSEEESVASQVDLIVAQSEIDGSMTLDHVEGIVVWEKVEYSFTVNSFLEEIGL